MAYLKAALWILAYAVLFFAITNDGAIGGLTDQVDADDDSHGFFSFLAVSVARKLIGAPAPAPVFECGSACVTRCSRSKQKDACLKYCGVCCHKCQCVPPGTAGNREACGPCYANWTTHGGRPKCP